MYDYQEKVSELLARSADSYMRYMEWIKAQIRQQEAQRQEQKQQQPANMVNPTIGIRG